MSKNPSVILTARVPAEVADRAAVIGLGNKSKGIVDAVMSFKGLETPQKAPAIPLKLIEDLSSRLASDAKFFEGLLGQASKGLLQASERLSVSVSVTEQSLAEAARREASLTCDTQQEFDEFLAGPGDGEEPVEFLVRAWNTEKQVERKYEAWEAENEGHAESVKNPHENLLKIWNHAVGDGIDAIGDRYPRFKDGEVMTKEERQAFSRQAIIADFTPDEDYTDTDNPKGAAGLSYDDKLHIAYGRLSEGVDHHGNMLELARRVAVLQSEHASAVNVAVRLVTWFNENPLWQKKGVSYEDLKEQVTFAERNIEIQLENFSKLVDLPNINPDKGFVFTAEELEAEIRKL